jgi:hypothetical protein
VTGVRSSVPVCSEQRNCGMRCEGLTDGKWRVGGGLGVGFADGAKVRYRLELAVYSSASAGSRTGAAKHDPESGTASGMVSVHHCRARSESASVDGEGR